MQEQPNKEPAGFSPTTNTAVVRYQAKDLDRSVAFYTEHLGFRLSQRTGPIAIVSRGDLHLILSGPGSSGARDMPDGRHQSPGGWNRITIYVDNLESIIEKLTKMGDVNFRNQVESGPGGSQILLDDPDGNPIELHEPPRKAH
jgi:catechol 2,3-dioxygenase-like lactoylglutathione lyase family enzyme